MIQPPEMMRPGLRQITAIKEFDGKKLRRNPVPPPPKIAWLALDQLVVDAAYQRAVSSNGLRLIRRLVENWDWNCFKPLSVAAAGDGLYEVIDGQHTALAAATHGAIETLPCLVLNADTIAQRSAAFVGINRDRVSLTPFALYQARLAAEDPEAIAVDKSLKAAGAQLLESLRYDVDYAPGALACISTLLLIVRTNGGHVRLTRALKICIEAGHAPIQSEVLKAVANLIAAKAAPDDDLVAALAEFDGDGPLDKAAERRRLGSAPNKNAAIMQIVLHQLEQEKAA